MLAYDSCAFSFLHLARSRWSFWHWQSLTFEFEGTASEQVSVPFGGRKPLCLDRRFQMCWIRKFWFSPSATQLLKFNVTPTRCRHKEIRSTPYLMVSRFNKLGHGHNSINNFVLLEITIRHSRLLVKGRITSLYHWCQQHRLNGANTQLHCCVHLQDIFS